MSRLGTICKRAGLTVVDRPVAGRPFEYGPPRGIMLHHTAGNAPGDLSVVTRGRAGLPGPLAQIYLSPAGVVHIVTEGRANHAGLGEWNYGGLVIPKDQGNRYLIGIEVSSMGSPIRGTQYAAMIRLVAALCEAYGWDARRVIRHRDYAPRRKSDIANDLATVRADVTKALGNRTPYPLTWPREFGYRAGTRGPWRLLLTDRGPHVRRINELLLGSSSSEYTARTASAVRTWQGKRTMPITGRVDRRTWARMAL